MSMTEAERHVADKVIKANNRLRWFWIVMAFVLLAGGLYLGSLIKQSNDELTAAINRSIEENKTQNEETRQFDTCLLLVPIEQRSQALQKQCFEEADQPGGLTKENFQTTPPEESDQPQQGTSSTPNPVSAPQNQPQAKSAPTAQSEPQSQPEPSPQESQPQQSVVPFKETCTVNLLGVCL